MRFHASSESTSSSDSVASSEASQMGEAGPEEGVRGEVDVSVMELVLLRRFLIV